MLGAAPSCYPAGIHRAHAPDGRYRLVVGLAVAIATGLPFLPVLSNGFVDLDDVDNIVGNPWVRGLGISNLSWMATSFHLGHWQPLSWVSLALDVRLWGDRMARGIHLTSLLLHATNAGLLAVLGMRIFAWTGRSTKEGCIAAALGALVWGLHPQRVESVAWATERRDVLSGFFLLLTALAYVPAPGHARRMTAALCTTACALLSKATAMVIPALLLVADVYPLRRLSGPARRWPVLLEKLPFAMLCAASAVVALAASRASGALQSLQDTSLAQRLGAAMYQLGFYLWKAVWPVDLLPLYEYPLDMGPAYPGAIAGIGIFAALAVVAWRLRRRVPGLGAALAAYTITLAPTLGLAQSGPQVAADRYSYVAMMGWSLGVGALVVSPANRARWRVILFAPVLVAAGMLTWQQCATWHDARTMWARVVARHPDHAFGHKMLGDAARLSGDLAAAESSYRAAIALRPLAEAYTNLASTLAAGRRFEEAFANYRTAVALNPRYAFAWTSYGVALEDAGQREEALAAHQRALAIDPGSMEAHVNLGSLLDDLGRPTEALAEYQQALHLMPSPEAYNDLGVLLLKLGRPADAVQVLQSGIALRADVAVLYENLGFALRASGNPAAALVSFQSALRIDPGLPKSRAAVSELSGAPSSAPP